MVVKKKPTVRELRLQATRKEEMADALDNRENPTATQLTRARHLREDADELNRKADLLAHIEGGTYGYR